MPQLLSLISEAARCVSTQGGNPVNFVTLLKPIVTLFVRLALLQRPASDVPYSPLLLALVLLVGAGFEVISSQLPPLVAMGDELAPLPFEPWRALLLSAVFSLLMAGGLWSLLTLFARGERFVQTFTAVTGASIVHTLGFIVAQCLVMGLQVSSSPLAGVLELSLMFWGFAILGHIFQEAFDLGPVAGGVAAVSFLVFLQILAIALVPGLFPYTSA